MFNPKVYEGYDGLREFREDALEIWESLTISATELVEEGDRVLVRTRVKTRGRGSGVPMEVEGAGIWTVADGRLCTTACSAPSRSTATRRSRRSAHRVRPQEGQTLLGN